MNLQKVVLVGCMLSAVALPQTPAAEPIGYYRIDFVIKEVEGGKVLNSRAYSMTTSTSPRNSSIRTGSKVPYQTGSGQYNYAEVGINIDCKNMKEENNRLILDVLAEVSSTAQGTEGSSTPIIRQNRWISTVTVPLNKPTTVFSSDDVTAKRQMQVEITATAAK